MQARVVDYKGKRIHFLGIGGSSMSGLAFNPTNDRIRLQTPLNASAKHMLHRLNAERRSQIRMIHNTDSASNNTVHKVLV